MVIKINGKEYRFNLDVKTKLFEEVQANPSYEVQKKFVKNILIPKMTDKELGELGILSMVKLIYKFNSALEKRILEIKKKLSH